MARRYARCIVLHRDHNIFCDRDGPRRTREGVCVSAYGGNTWAKARIRPRVWKFCRGPAVIRSAARRRATIGEALPTQSQRLPEQSVGTIGCKNNARSYEGHRPAREIHLAPGTAGDAVLHIAWRAFGRSYCAAFRIANQ